MNLYQKLFLGRQSPFIIIAAAVVVWLLCLPLFQDGMFIDGIQYAAVSRNLALGVGTFWNPVLAQNSVAGLNSFHEHPPVVFFIQSLFFKIFGFKNIYPERIYCLFTFLITGLFIALSWRKLFVGQSTRQLWWLPVLLWIIMPIVFWAYTNDIQEDTMGVFTTAAVYFFLVAVNSRSVLLSVNFYLGCFCVLLAALCKGVPGLFPIVFFFIYWLSLRKIDFKSVVIYSLTAGLFLSAAVFIILQNPVAKEALHTWFFDRMLKRISSDPVEQSHFYILEGLFTEQLPAIIAVALALIVFRLKQVKNEIDRRTVVLFLLLGLAASLPLMLTLVQRNFYFIPALPLFAIAWALIFADGLNRAIDDLEERLKYRNAITVFAIAALLAGISFTIYSAGKIKRDKEMLQNVYTIKMIVPDNSFVSVTSDIMWMNWSFRCYMMRYNSISFSDKDTCSYFIAYPTDKIEDKYVPVEAPLHMMRIFKSK
jgi:hypothetical protein